MMKNTNQRMSAFIKGQLLRQNFNVFSAETDDQQANLIIRNLSKENVPEYIEICILSRTEEYNTEIEIPIQLSENNFYYYILHSPGIGKIWLLRSDELINLRAQGMDNRDSGPYLVKNFDRLKYPYLSLEEYRKKNY